MNWIEWMCSCEKCGRQILVRELVNGAPHTLQLVATCWGCLTDVERARVAAWQEGKNVLAREDEFTEEVPA